MNSMQMGEKYKAEVRARILKAVFRPRDVDLLSESFWAAATRFHLVACAKTLVSLGCARQACLPGDRQCSNGHAGPGEFRRRGENLMAQSLTRSPKNPKGAKLLLVRHRQTCGGSSYLADHLLARRIGGLAGTLVFPCTLVITKFIYSHGPQGSGGALPYIQTGNLPLRQLLSVTGLWGIPFLIGWFASVAGQTWQQPPVRRL